MVEHHKCVVDPREIYYDREFDTIESSDPLAEFRHVKDPKILMAKAEASGHTADLILDQFGKLDVNHDAHITMAELLEVMSSRKNPPIVQAAAMLAEQHFKEIDRSSTGREFWFGQDINKSELLVRRYEELKERKDW